MQYNPSNLMKINKNLDFLEAAMETLTAEIAEGVEPELTLAAFNQKAHEAIRGLKEASSVAQEHQMNVETAIERAASEHQEILDTLQAVSLDCSEASIETEVASSIDRCIKKAQSVHALLFKQL